jgi:glycosyltransferase involved in cell wall biosynthesis
LDTLDLYIASSKSESFNLSVMEALQARVRCVVSDSPGHQHYLEAGMAIGYTPGDRMSFAQAVNLALNTEGPSTKALEEFSGRFTAENVAEKYLQQLGVLQPRA